MLPPGIMELLDRQALSELVIRWCRAVDRADEELLLSCYHPDAYDDHGRFKGTPAGLVEYFREGVMNADTRRLPMQHAVSNMTFEVDGDVAYGETYIEGRSVRDDGSLGTTIARYIDRFERRDGAWRIAKRVTIIESASASRDLSNPMFARGSRHQTDPSYRQT